MIKVLELFGGIGACTKALENLGIEHEVVDYVEIDKYAVKSYNAIHNTNFEPQDITTWNKTIDVDLIMHGSPCQDFSISGKGAGGDKGSGTRSSLMYETIRIVEKLKPKYVIWENVKNLLSTKHRHNFDNYLKVMGDLGYNSYYQVLDSQNYGVPQHRERVYTVSIREDIDNSSFRFPDEEKLESKLKDYLEEELDQTYYISEKLLNCFLSEDTKGFPRKDRFIQSLSKVNKEQVANTIITTEGNKPNCNFIIKKDTENYIEWLQKGRLDVDCRAFKEDKICGSIVTTPKNKVLINKTDIRKLSPKECWRLMTFTDEDFNKAKSTGNSDTQLYKQAGNSIVVRVLEKILYNLLKGGEQNDNK